MRAEVVLNSLITLSLLAAVNAAPVWAQGGKVFNLSATQNGRANNATLDRKHDAGNKDPFSGTDDDGEMLTPTTPYKSNTMKPQVAKPQKPFNLQADDQGNGNYQSANPMNAPTDMGGEPDAMPNQVQQPPQQPQFNPNDPDSSPDMQLAWDMWHKRVAQCIFERFNFFAKAAFRHSPPIMAKMTYTVTRDGHITNLNMPQKSTNVLFNVLVFQSVKSLDGDMSILQFPEGSRRMFVPKSGVFTQNYGSQAGFRYTVGDQETLRGGGRR